MSVNVHPGFHGSFPGMIEPAPASGALAAGVAVGFDTNGRLAIATGATVTNLFGVTEEAATAQDQLIKVMPVPHGGLLKLTKTGTATPRRGGRYDLAADGLSINADDVTDPKVKVIAPVPPLPGQSAVSEWFAINIAFDL